MSAPADPTGGDLLYFFVLSNPTPGDDDEYNQWYTNRHIVDVVKLVPGVRSVQRFALADEQRRDPPYAYRYLAFYEVERDQAAEVFAQLRSISGTEIMPVSDTFQRDHIALVFTPITGKVTADTV